MSEFITTAELIQKRHSGWSDAKCSLCGQPVTNAAKAYSLKIYGKPYCNSCQRVAEPIQGKEKQSRVCQSGEKKKIDYI